MSGDSQPVCENTHYTPPCAHMAHMRLAGRDTILSLTANGLNVQMAAHLRRVTSRRLSARRAKYKSPYHPHERGSP